MCGIRHSCRARSRRFIRCPIRWIRYGQQPYCRHCGSFSARAKTQGQSRTSGQRYAFPSSHAPSIDERVCGSIPRRFSSASMASNASSAGITARFTLRMRASRATIRICVMVIPRSSIVLVSDVQTPSAFSARDPRSHYQDEDDAA
jgi:hypothetical protein